MLGWTQVLPRRAVTPEPGGTEFAQSRLNSQCLGWLSSVGVSASMQRSGGGKWCPLAPLSLERRFWKLYLSQMLEEQTVSPFVS